LECMPEERVEAQNPKIKCPQRCIAGDCVTTGQVTKDSIRNLHCHFLRGNLSELKSHISKKVACR